jgi:hypothetical protein
MAHRPVLLERALVTDGIDGEPPFINPGRVEAP